MKTPQEDAADFIVLAVVHEAWRKTVESLRAWPAPEQLPSMEGADRLGESPAIGEPDQ